MKPEWQSRNQNKSSSRVTKKDSDPRTRERNRSASSLGDAITLLFSKQIIPGPALTRQIDDAWTNAAGPDIGQKTRAVSWKDRVFTVAVSSSALRYELNSFHRPTLEDNLRRESGFVDLKRIRFEPERA